MNLKCLIGIHAWEGCKCPECGKTCDKNHNWNADCEKCSKCGKARDAAHTWAGCKCQECGKTRDKDHDWKADCEKCSKCGKARDVAHAWAGCKCSKCGKTRDEAHDWTINCEKCAVCGKTRDSVHQWNGISCKICGELVSKTSLHANDDCLVVRFNNVESRNMAFSALYQKSWHSHIQAFTASGSRNGVSYYKRGFAPGRFVIVLNSGYVSDTWHCREFEFLNNNKLEFCDIDYVSYLEIRQAL